MQSTTYRVEGPHGTIIVAPQVGIIKGTSSLRGLVVLVKFYIVEAAYATVPDNRVGEDMRLTSIVPSQKARIPLFGQVKTNVSSNKNVARQGYIVVHSPSRVGSREAMPEAHPYDNSVTAGSSRIRWQAPE